MIPSESIKAEQALTPEQTLKLAWDYFSLHAGQRITLFNYFITLSSLVFAGMGFCLRSNGEFTYAGGIFGILLIVLAIVFWKIDERTATIIKHAEVVIKQIESDHVAPRMRLFNKEANAFEEARSKKFLIVRAWSYRECFQLAYTIVGLAGGVGLIIALIQATQST